MFRKRYDSDEPGSNDSRFRIEIQIDEEIVVVNVGFRNKNLLVDLLVERLEQEIDNIRLNQYYSHNFTKEKPYFKLELTVSAESFENAVLKGEIEILKKQLERAKKADPDVVDIGARAVGTVTEDGS
jgi:hypothetical protein